MKRSCFFSAVLLLAASDNSIASGPYDGKTFKGRIAYSSDGNHNDEDDWAASPVALAILAECGLKDRLVHFDYNCILPKTDPEWEKIHATSVLGAAQRYGFDKSLLYDCRRDLDGAVEGIAREINASSADNPLYFIIAGPMEVPYLGIQKSNPAKRKFVYCISHSRWNDGFDLNYVYTYNKRSLIPLGIKWIQVRDQNAGLSTSRYGRAARPDEWEPWLWMRDSKDEKVRFLWQRMQATTRADCSDAGMAYFLATGDEYGDPVKLRKLLNEHAAPRPIVSRETIRLEAENFLTLDGFELEYRNDRQVSHRLNVRVNANHASGVAKAHISSPFFEPYSADDARYDVSIRFAGTTGGHFQLLIEGRPYGTPWVSTTKDGTWAVHTIHDVPLRRGDEIAVTVQGDDVASSRLDYVELALLRGAGNR